MLIFNENNQAIIIDNINGPILSDYFWTLDCNFNNDIDFTLNQLLILEETHCPSLKLMIEGFEFFVPGHWNILVMDEETTEIDVVQIEKVTGTDFKAVVYGPNLNRARAAEIIVTDYDPCYKNISPALKKTHMLCHPIGPNTWINIAPSDGHKYLKNKSIGDIT